MKNGHQVFAVIRFDRFLLDDAPLESCVTVKEVVDSAEAAEREAARLNALVNDEGVLYAWQPTRWSDTLGQARGSDRRS